VLDAYSLLLVDLRVVLLLLLLLLLLVVDRLCLVAFAGAVFGAYWLVVGTWWRYCCCSC